MKKYVLISLLISASLFFAAGQDLQTSRGIDILHYSFALTLSDSSDLIKGNTGIDLVVSGKTDSVSFDLKCTGYDGRGMVVDRVLIDGSPAKWNHRSDRLSAATDFTLTSGDTVHLTIEYHGFPADGLIISRNTFGDRTFFSDHWPDRAHAYLPCIDHPSDKATVDFTVTAPETYSVVSNGFMTEESSLPCGLKLTSWRENKPLPVKVMAFGAARFAVRYEGSPDNVPVCTWVFPQNRSAGFSDFAMAVKPLEYFSTLVGAYPFEKLANVQSRTMFGGMENAGAIFYAENAVTGKGKADQLIAHEIAHQWFGDCVTESDWSQVWLSEGFATYLSAMYGESVNGEKWFNDEMTRDRNMVARYLRRSAMPIIDTAEANLIDLLNPNSYQKGAWVLHMLRNNIGDEVFIKGLRTYYARFRYSNASSEEFRKVMEEVSGKDLSVFFRQWLYSSGHPVLKITKAPGKTRGTTDIIITQVQKALFVFDLELLLKSEAGDSREKIHVGERTVRYTVKHAILTEIIPDPEVKLLFDKAD